jgi:hypothetical protein
MKVLVVSNLQLTFYSQNNLQLNSKFKIYPIRFVFHFHFEKYIYKEGLCLSISYSKYGSCGMSQLKGLTQFLKKVYVFTLELPYLPNQIIHLTIYLYTYLSRYLA